MYVALLSPSQVQAVCMAESAGMPPLIFDPDLLFAMLLTVFSFIFVGTSQIRRLFGQQPWSCIVLVAARFWWDLRGSSCHLLPLLLHEATMVGCSFWSWTMFQQPVALGRRFGCSATMRHTHGHDGESLTFWMLGWHWLKIANQSQPLDDYWQILITLLAGPFWSLWCGGELCCLVSAFWHA